MFTELIYQTRGVHLVPLAHSQLKLTRTQSPKQLDRWKYTSIMINRSKNSCFRKKNEDQLLFILLFCFFVSVFFSGGNLWFCVFDPAIQITPRVFDDQSLAHVLIWIQIHSGVQRRGSYQIKIHLHLKSQQSTKQAWKKLHCSLQ